MQRFVSYMAAPDEDGCILWEGTTNNGYGVFTWKVGGKLRYPRAHRWYYEQIIGPIPQGLTLDHLCHGPECPGGADCKHRRCVNPEHLEPVTNRENMLRHNHANTTRTENQCRHGHEMVEENIQRVTITQNGKRVVKERCLTCHRDRARESARRKYAKLREQQNNPDYI